MAFTSPLKEGVVLIFIVLRNPLPWPSGKINKVLEEIFISDWLELA
jgi:hypothetical protein